MTNNLILCPCVFNLIISNLIFFTNAQQVLKDLLKLKTHQKQFDFSNRFFFSIILNKN